MPARQRPVVEYLRASYRISGQRACRVVRLNRGTFLYRSHKDPCLELRLRIREIAQARSQWKAEVAVRALGQHDERHVAGKRAARRYHLNCTARCTVWDCRYK